MKTLIGTIIAAFPCLTGFGQGQVQFCNINGGAGVNAPVFDSLNTTVKLAGANWQAGLYAGLTSTSLAYVGNSAPFLTAGGAGYFNGGTVTLPGIPGGATVWLQVVVWDATLQGTTTGATWPQVVASCPPCCVWGRSRIFPVVTGNPDTIPPQTPAPLVGLASFHLSGSPYDSYFHGFTVQPQSQTVVAGHAVSFSVAVDWCAQMSLSWNFNGTPIPGASSSVYWISSVQRTNAGSYDAIAYVTGLGAYRSLPATLTVLVPPTITSAPQSQTAEQGSVADFAVRFDGFPTPACQWFFNGNPLLGKTDALLRVPDVQPGHAGPYTVVVTNIAGAVTSPPAMLSVIAPVERRPVPALTLMGQSGTLLNLEYAGALSGGVNWQPLESVTLSNTSQFYFDPSAPLPGQRFYRGWQAGVPNLAPLLDLHMVPGLVLTGSVGSRWRVDAINVFGPTDAWFTLDTVTLTNATQLYLDTSSIHQPRRLWRVIPQ